MTARGIIRSSDRLLCSLLRSYDKAINRPQMLQYSQKSSSQTNNAEKDADAEIPVKFTSSAAADFDAMKVRAGSRTNRAEYEHIIVRVSVVVFMVYFCVLREENDIDASLGNAFYNQLPELELIQLRSKRDKSSSVGAEPFTEADRLRLEYLENQK